MSLIEAVASLLILINVWLVARRSIWNYAFGIAGVLLSAWVFFGARLYSDTLLQGFFFVLQIYGWWQWSRSEAASGEVVVDRIDTRSRLLWSCGILLAILFWGFLMHALTDASLPWWDAAVAMVSIAAQILMALRKVENWALWIVANLLSIGLYATKHLWAFTGLYVILLALSIWGLERWLGARRAVAA